MRPRNVSTTTLSWTRSKNSRTPAQTRRSEAAAKERRARVMAGLAKSKGKGIETAVQTPTPEDLETAADLAEGIDAEIDSETEDTVPSPSTARVQMPEDDSGIVDDSSLDASEYEAPDNPNDIF